MCYIVHNMTMISIRDLHMHTGRWVRQAETAAKPLLISDRGRPIARLMPLEGAEHTPFSDRVFVEGFETLPPVGMDSAHLLEEDRR